MIKIEKTQIAGFESAIRGMRNPKNSWDKSDSLYVGIEFANTAEEVRLADICGKVAPIIGKNDMKLMQTLAQSGDDHGKFTRMITVYVDITAPLYWWKEFDTYKVGTVADSCSTMHKIHAKEFELDDFSHEHLFGINETFLSDYVIRFLNANRELFNETKDKDYWWQMIQMLPTSYNQKRTVMLNYQVLWHMYNARKNHKLDEWHAFCDWIETLPYFKDIYGIGG